MNNVVKKKKLGVVSYIGIGIIALILLAFIGLCIIDTIQNGSNEYAVFGRIVGFGALLIPLLYYGSALAISIVIDITSGKGSLKNIKDILIIIAYIAPIFFIIFMRLISLFI